MTTDFLGLAYRGKTLGNLPGQIVNFRLKRLLALHPQGNFFGCFRFLFVQFEVGHLQDALTASELFLNLGMVARELLEREPQGFSRGGTLLEVVGPGEYLDELVFERK